MAGGSLMGLSCIAGLLDASKAQPYATLSVEESCSEKVEGM